MTVHTEQLTAARVSPSAWLVVGFAVGFGVPFVFADVLEIQRDLYYGIYAAATALLFAGWLRHEGTTVSEFARRRWRSGVIAGAFGAIATVAAVLRVEDSTARPDGFELTAAVAWRGVVYGAVDGLLLAVFPIVVVYAWLAPHRRRWLGRVGVAVSALVASLAMTAVYHAGYAEFRDGDLAKPVGGSIAWNVPTLVTASPVASPIAHVGMHVTAVVRSYETETFLPPHDG